MKHGTKSKPEVNQRIFFYFAKFSIQNVVPGLPNNQLPSVPTEGLAHLWRLDRLDLSNNKIHTLDANSFKVNATE